MGKADGACKLARLGPALALLASTCATAQESEPPPADAAVLPEVVVAPPRSLKSSLARPLE